MENSTSSVYYGVSKPRIFLASMIQSSNTLFKIAVGSLTYIATGGFGLTVLLAGWIASAARIFDGITDPIAAWFVPKVRSRFGVARPTIFMGYFLQLATVFLLYHVFPGKVSGVTGVVIYTALYFVNIIGYTLLNMGNELLQNTITNDPKKRPLVFRYSATVTSLVTMVYSIYRTKILYPKYGEISVPYLQELSTIIFILATIMVVVGLIAAAPADNAENFEKNFHGATKFKLKDIWNLIAHNPAFLSCFISKATDKVASETASNSAVNTLLFGIVIGNYAFSGDISVYNTIISLLLIWVVTGRAKKKGNASAYVRWSWINIAIAVATAIFMLVIDTTTISVSIVPTVIFVILFGIIRAFKSAMNASIGTLQADIVDYEFYLHGKYLGPLVSSVSNVLGKIFDSVSSVIIAWCLGMLGYTSTMPQPGDPMTDAVLWVTLFLWLGLPLLGSLASVIAMHWYPLTKEKMEEVQAANKLRREQNAEIYEAEERAAEKSAAVNSSRK